MVNLLLELRSQKKIYHRIYFNTLKALDFLDKGGHGINLENYPSHIVLAFDLTSTQEISFIQNLQTAQFRFKLHLTEHWQPT